MIGRSAFVRLDEPVFDLQPRDTFELTDIVRDKHQLPGTCLPCNQRVVRAYRRTSGSQIRTDFAGMLRILDIERDDLELQCLDARHVRGGSLALVCAVMASAGLRRPSRYRRSVPGRNRSPIHSDQETINRHPAIHLPVRTL